MLRIKKTVEDAHYPQVPWNFKRNLTKHTPTPTGTVFHLHTYKTAICSSPSIENQAQNVLYYDQHFDIYSALCCFYL